MITNDILKMALRFTGKVGVLASEEEDQPVSHSVLIVDNMSRMGKVTVLNISFRLTNDALLIALRFHCYNH